MHVVVPIVILGLSLVSLFSMAMFNVFLLNLLPQSCGQWFLLCQISSFCERRIFHCKFPFLKEKMLEKELIFLSNLLTIWKGAQDFLLSYFEYYQFWLNVCLDDQLSLNPSASSQFFKKSLVERVVRNMIFWGGGTWTTQKEQLADAGPTAPICNHTDMGLWQRTDDLILVMWGASEVIQYQALFISKISPKRKVRSRK